MAGENEEDNASAPKQLARSPTLHYSPIEGKAKGQEIEMSEAEETEEPPPPPPKQKSQNKVAQPEEQKTEKKTACKRRASKPEGQEEKKDMPKKKTTETQPDEQVPKQVSKPPKSAKDPAASLPSPKQEPPSTDIANAVNSSLARAATVDLQSVAAPPEIAMGNDEPDSADGSPGDEPDPEGVTAQEVRRRKEVHARYMRFSRSLKSILANLSALFIIVLFCVHVQYKRYNTPIPHRYRFYGY